MSQDTITAKVIEMYERQVQVPANLPYEKRQEHAFLQCRGRGPKPTQVTQRYTEDISPISYKEILVMD